MVLNNDLVNDLRSLLHLEDRSRVCFQFVICARVSVVCSVCVGRMGCGVHCDGYVVCMWVCCVLCGKCALEGYDTCHCVELIYCFPAFMHNILMCARRHVRAL